MYLFREGQTLQREKQDKDHSADFLLLIKL